MLLGLFKVRDALGLFESVLVLLDRILAHEVEVLAGAQIGILETRVARGRRDLTLTRVLALVERRCSSASDHDYSRPARFLVKVWLQQEFVCANLALLLDNDGTTAGLVNMRSSSGWGVSRGTVRGEGERPCRSHQVRINHAQVVVGAEALALHMKH